MIHLIKEPLIASRRYIHTLCYVTRQYYEKVVHLKCRICFCILNIVLKSGPARRVDPGLEPCWVEEKIGKKKTRYDPATWLTQQDLVKDPVATRWFLFFLLKRYRFDLKKKNWPRQPGDSVKTWNQGLGPDWPRSKNYGFKGALKIFNLFLFFSLL
jgi:hypothetical protein